MGNMGLGFLFTAKDLASGTFGKVGQNFNNLDQSVKDGTERIRQNFDKVMKGFGLMTAGAVAIGGAFLLAGPSGDFEQAIAQVGAVANATAADLKMLEEAAIQAGIQTQYSPIEAAQGLRELAAAGYSARESVDLLLPTLNLAAGSLGELTVESSAGLASQAIKAFGLESKDATLVVDQLIQATNTFALSAGDLPLALGTAARGAASTNQTLGDTLVALGLVKNIIPGVERASTSVAVAMERMANPQVQKQLRGLGIAVDDGKGSFRSLLDVLGDMAPALDKMSDVKRAGFLQKTFGSEALAGINAVLTQMTKGVKTADGQIVQGADALAYLRRQMDGAGGAAKAFADQNLATFNGQKTLLAGSMQTLAIEMGKPFVQVLKPVVKGIVAAVNFLIERVQRMPEGLKRFMAGAVVVTGAVLALTGAALAAKGAFAILAIAAKAFAVAAAPIVAAIAPAVLALAPLAAAAVAVFAVIKTNIGGLGEVIMRPFRAIRLAWQATTQLFRDGAFSGSVLAELDKGNNSVKQFAIFLYRAFYRIVRFFEGIGEGFWSVWNTAIAPVVDELREAFTGVGEALSQLWDVFASAMGGMTGEVNNFVPASRGFASAGQVIGGAIATVIGWFAKGLTYAVHFVGFLISGFTEVAKGAAVLGERIGTLGGAIYLWFAERIPPIWARFASLARAVFEPVIAFFNRTVETIESAIARIFDVLVKAIRKMPDWAVPEGLADLKTSDEEAQAERTKSAQRAVQTMPAAAQAEVANAERMAVGGDLAGALALLTKTLDGAMNRPVIVQVNGETIARAAADGQWSIDERTFVPVATR